MGQRFSTIGRHPERGAEYLPQASRLADTLDRGAIDRGMQTHTVTGTGHIKVDVNAPKGTRVAAQGGGLFKKTTVNRQHQMEPAVSSFEE